APHPMQVGPAPRPVIRINGNVLHVPGVGPPPVDLLDMAQDRRWQSIDTIRVFKSVVGTGLMVAGAYQGSKEHPDPGSAAALLIGGALLKATASGDVRHWEMLPRNVFIVPLILPPGKHNVSVSFNDGTGQTWRGVLAPEHGEATYYIRASRWGGGREWPPPGMPPAPEVAVKTKPPEPAKTDEPKMPVKQNISSSVYDR